MNNLPQVCEDRRRFRPQNNAARERSRVKTLRSAFLDLQRSLPAVPPNTKLSKLDILILATAYIYHLTRTLEGQEYDLDGTVTNQQSNSKKMGQSHCSRSDNCEDGRGELSQTSASHALYRNIPLPHTHSSKMLTLSCITGQAVKAKRMKLNGESENTEKGMLNAYCSSQHQYNTGQMLLSEPSHHHDTLQREYSCASKSHYNNEIVTRGHGVNCDGGSTWTRKQRAVGVLHPVKKWPMRSRLYDSILGCPATSIALLHTPSVSFTPCMLASQVSDTTDSGFNSFKPTQCFESR